MMKHKKRHRPKLHLPHHYQGRQLLQQVAVRMLADGRREDWECAWLSYLSTLDLPDHSDKLRVFTCQRCGFVMSTVVAAAGHVPVTLDCCRESLTGAPCQPRTPEQASELSAMAADWQWHTLQTAPDGLGAPRFTWQRPSLVEYLTLADPDAAEWVRRGGLLPYLNRPSSQSTEEE
jgi:hypothetical protein